MSVIDPSLVARTAEGESGKLHRRALGVPDLVFFIVAASALSIPSGISPAVR